MIKLKRVYEKPEKGDGYRVLVDRLWPRGMTKEKAALDLWLKDVAPSSELRKWFGHDPKRWSIFKKKYKMELSKSMGTFQKLKNIVKQKKNITFLYAAKDEERNEAVILKDLL